MTDSETESRGAITLLPPDDEDTNPGLDPIPSFVPKPVEHIPEAPDWMNRALQQMWQMQAEYAAYNQQLLRSIEVRERKHRKSLQRATNLEAKNHQAVLDLERRVEAIELDVRLLKNQLGNQ